MTTAAPTFRLKQPSPTLEQRAMPPLQNGDRLTGEEFERRYASMPEGAVAELVEGVVYMPPPCFEEDHGIPHSDINGWLSYYRGATPGVVASDNSSLRLDTRNRPQPDGYLRILHGGGARRAADGYVEGGPELIVEVAASSVSRDLHDKLAAYRRNGVREYIVWRTYDREIDWLVLGPRRQARLRPTAAGIYKSRVFPGLWLDGPALIRGDLATVYGILKEGIASPDHAAFVAKLAKAAARRK